MEAKLQQNASVQMPKLQIEIAAISNRSDLQSQSPRNRNQIASKSAEEKRVEIATEI